MLPVSEGQHELVLLYGHVCHRLYATPSVRYCESESCMPSPVDPIDLFTQVPAAPLQQYSNPHPKPLRNVSPQVLKAVGRLKLKPEIDAQSADSLFRVGMLLSDPNSDAKIAIDAVGPANYTFSAPHRRLGCRVLREALLARRGFTRVLGVPYHDFLACRSVALHATRTMHCINADGTHVFETTYCPVCCVAFSAPFVIVDCHYASSPCAQLFAQEGGFLGAHVVPGHWLDRMAAHRPRRQLRPRAWAAAEVAGNGRGKEAAEIGYQGEAREADEPADRAARSAREACRRGWR